MPDCLFTSDLHGIPEKYQKLFTSIEVMRPEWVFLGGDLLPAMHQLEFLNGYLISNLRKLSTQMGEEFPLFLVIMGNDDPRLFEIIFQQEDEKGLWYYMHQKKLIMGEYVIYGYAHVPPSPFLLKDWERYDISRFTDVGSVGPELGYHSLATDLQEISYLTIARELEQLTKDEYSGNSIFLFHSPPYQTNLDRAALDGKMFDHAPLDVHVGSIAIRNFIEKKQPLLTLHGHIHESPRITGSWQDRIGASRCFSAAHDGPELALIRFNPEELDQAERLII
ncbi:MAG: metallophosphoesterase [Candidatus Cloacimonetes bacterium]|nr:metallophosphoesterase [Candidatus Cloacimonadota bacterium]